MQAVVRPHPCEEKCLGTAAYTCWGWLWAVSDYEGLDVGDDEWDGFDVGHAPPAMVMGVSMTEGMQGS